MSKEISDNSPQSINRIALFGKAILFSIVGGFYLLGLNLLSGNSQLWYSFIQGWFFSLLVIGISFALFFIFAWLRSWRIIYLILGILYLFAWILYLSSSNTTLEWILLPLSLAIFLRIDDHLTKNSAIFPSFIVHGLLAMGVGFGLIVLVQIESQFAEEEFFTAIQGFVISGYWLLILILDRSLIREIAVIPTQNSYSKRPLLIGIIVLFISGSIVSILAYQRSFYSPDAPGYSDINPRSPFTCGQVKPDDQVYLGEEVFNGLMQNLESKPLKSSPELGMLALGAGKKHWADQFRQSLL